MDNRTYVITIDAQNLPERYWPMLGKALGNAVEKVIRDFTREGATIMRRIDDVGKLLEDVD